MKLHPFYREKLSLIFLAMTTLLLLEGCASTTKVRHQKLSNLSKMPKKTCYRVKNKNYCVLKSARGFTEKGEASWYGPGFHGKKTASGKIYNQNKMTAAHKTLPFGTKVIVKNLKNNKSVQVKITDRGPFHGNRIIDLSKKAAEKIGIQGVSTVFIQTL